MRRVYLTLMLLVTIASAAAQRGRANYKLALRFEDEIERFNNDLTVNARFINKTDKFWYSFKDSDGVKFYLVDPAKKTKTELFDMDDVLGQISQITGEAYNSKKFQSTSFEFDKTGRNMKFYFDNLELSYNFDTKKITQLAKSKPKIYGSSAHVYSPDSTLVIYAHKNNLYVYGNKEKGQDTTVVQLTFDGVQDFSYSKYPNEPQGEHTAPQGRWLKNSKQFLVFTEDQREVDSMAVIETITKGKPIVHSYKYSCPGDSSITQYGLKIIDIASKKVTVIPTQKWKDQYAEYAYDTKKGDKIFFYRTKRTWNEKELCVYKPATGEVRVLINEVDKPFFDYVIAQTHFLNDGKEIILRSERTGYGHFYLYDGETGKLKRTITSGAYVTGQIHEIDTLKRNIYFYAFGREKGSDPYYYTLYKANLDKGGVELLTPGNFHHNVDLSPSRKFIIDCYSTVSTEPVNVVRDDKGKVIMTLDKPDLKSVYQLGWQKPTRFKVKAADGVTDLYGVMWKPMDFDSTKTYPIISEVYPGPQFEYVPVSFTLKESHATKLAQLGFIVIQVGHRGGTPIRGKVYHRDGYGRMRDYPLADDKVAISQLADRYKFIDPTKVGIFGHSGGGFMSTAALCSYPDFYTAAVSAAGNHDNSIYNTGWIEMNNGVREVIKKPKEGKAPAADSITFQASKIHTNMELAKNYKGHLLLVTGLMDKNVNPAHTFRMAKALMEAGKNFDMICLPTSTHGFNGEEDTFFVRKMWRHFAKYLLNDDSGDYQADINKFYEKTKQ